MCGPLLLLSTDSGLVLSAGQAELLKRLQSDARACFGCLVDLPQAEQLKQLKVPSPQGNYITNHINAWM